MPFDKIVNLCKQASIQFKILSTQLAKSRIEIGSASKQTNTSNKVNADGGNTTTNQAEMNQIDQNYDLENYHHHNSNHSNSPMSGALFLNDESNLTITGDYLNRSSNDCIGMDLDESLGHVTVINIFI